MTKNRSSVNYQKCAACGVIHANPESYNTCGPCYLTYLKVLVAKEQEELDALLRQEKHLACPLVEV